MNTCPECGARLRPGETCGDLFNRMLAVEWAMIGLLEESTDEKASRSSDAGAIGTRAHFFAVGSYQLQHPDGLTAEALVGLYAGLGDVLAGRRAVADIRLEARRAFDGPQRVRRRPEDGRDPALGPWPAEWPVTVADCCDVAPEAYADAVERLAEATVAAIDAVRSAARGQRQPRRPAPPPPRAGRRPR